MGKKLISTIFLTLLIIALLVVGLLFLLPRFQNGDISLNAPPSGIPSTTPTSVATTVPTTVATTVPTTVATTIPSTMTTTQPTTVPTVSTAPTVTQCSHVYELQVMNATCQDGGYTRHTCSVCGHHYDDALTDPVDHSYGAWRTEKESTCTAKGRQTRQCKWCPQQEEETLSALGHSYGAWTAVKAASCTAAGTQNRTCKRCQTEETKTVEALGHDYDDGIVTKQAASCTVTGTLTYTCRRCHITKETTFRGAHDLVYETADGSEIPWVRCNNCDFSYTNMVVRETHTEGYDPNSAMFTDVIHLKEKAYTGRLSKWPEHWFEYKYFIQIGINGPNQLLPPHFTSIDYISQIYKIENIQTEEQADALFADFDAFLAEFEDFYGWKSTPITRIYDPKTKTCTLRYLNDDQYKAFAKQRKNVSAAKKKAIAEDLAAYYIHNSGLYDGMLVYNAATILCQIAHGEVAFYDLSYSFHDAYDGFAAATCVCDGFSEIFQYLAAYCGINSKEVLGSVYSVGHAWNKITFSDGVVRYVDPTNDSWVRTAEELRKSNYKW